MTIAADREERERADEEAAKWLVLLSEAPEDGDLRARFEAWHGASDLNAAIWARTVRAYDLVGRGTPRHKQHWQSHAARTPTPFRPGAMVAPRQRSTGRARAWRLSAGVAAGALAACFLIAVVPGALLHLQADYVTATAQTRTVVLDDGTSIRLAPESAIDVALGGSERRVRLLKGVAFFEVTPDAVRPFRVAAGDAVATVLGTAFDVRLREDGADVAVQRGRVRVDDEAASPPISTHLRAGDWVRVTWGAGVTQGSIPPEDVGDWRRGQLVARDRPVREIVDELRRYYSGMIVLRGEAFAERRVSGIYDLRDPVATLQGLAASHGATVRRISPWLLIVTAG